MKKTITIPVKTFSINDQHTRNKSYTTGKYKDWTSKVFYQLDKPEPKKALEELREYIDPKVHLISVHMIAYYPFDVVFTKAGQASSRCHDITNWEKPLIDLIFLPKHFNTSVPYGCKNLNIDDKYLISCSSEKGIADEHKIEIIIKVHHKQDIFPEYFQSKEQSSNDDTEEP